VRPSAEFGTHSGLLGTGPDGGIAAVSSNLQFDLLLELVDHLWPSVDQALPAQPTIMSLFFRLFGSLVGASMLMNAMVKCVKSLYDYLCVESEEYLDEVKGDHRDKAAAYNDKYKYLIEDDWRSAKMRQVNKKNIQLNLYSKNTHLSKKQYQNDILGGNKHRCRFGKFTYLPLLGLLTVIL
jgi:hypothetical protein